MSLSSGNFSWTIPLITFYSPFSHFFFLELFLMQMINGHTSSNSFFVFYFLSVFLFHLLQYIFSQFLYFPILILNLLFLLSSWIFLRVLIIVFFLLLPLSSFYCSWLVSIHSEFLCPTNLFWPLTFQLEFFLKYMVILDSLFLLRRSTSKILLEAPVT